MNPSVRSTFAVIRQLRLRVLRDQTGLHFIEGFRNIVQALDARIPIETLVYSEILAQNPLVQKKVRLEKRIGVPVVRVRPEEFRAISQTERASGIGAIVRQHWTALESIDPRDGLCWVAVSFLRSRGNLGTLIRTAEAVGAGGLIFLGHASDPFDPDVVRASMGGLFRLRVSRSSLTEFAAWSRRHGCRVIGTSPSAVSAYTEVPVEPPVVILFGEERGGLTSAEQEVCTHRARIPIVGRADSLNVGVAAGVMLYEVLRRSESRRTV